MWNVSTGAMQSKFFRIKIFESLEGTGQALLSWWLSSSIWTKLWPKFQNKVCRLFFQRKFLKTGWGSHFKFFHSYTNYVINPQILTIILNIFENIDKKFHNDPRKTLGDMYIYFRGGLTFVALFIFPFFMLTLILPFTSKLLNCI